MANVFATCVGGYVMVGGGKILAQLVLPVIPEVKLTNKGLVNVCIDAFIDAIRLAAQRK